MNGVHDLGGMDGFTLLERDQGFPLHEPWERDFWGTVMALRKVPLGPGRPRLERIPPVLYLSLPYYAKWLYAREQALIEYGYVTAAELADPDGPISMPRLPAGFAPASAAEAVALLGTDTSERLDVDVPARFEAGDRVMARNEHPIGHTRMPRYVRGRTGRITTLHGPNRFTDELPPGVELGPQHLYTVAFAARELWGSRGHANDVIHVELWEFHLASA